MHLVYLQPFFFETNLEQISDTTLHTNSSQLLHTSQFVLSKTVINRKIQCEPSRSRLPVNSTFQLCETRTNDPIFAEACCRVRFFSLLVFESKSYVYNYKMRHCRFLRNCEGAHTHAHIHINTEADFCIFYNWGKKTGKITTKNGRHWHLHACADSYRSVEYA